MKEEKSYRRVFKLKNKVSISIYWDHEMERYLAIRTKKNSSPQDLIHAFGETKKEAVRNLRKALGKLVIKRLEESRLGAEFIPLMSESHYQNERQNILCAISFGQLTHEQGKLRLEQLTQTYSAQKNMVMPRFIK